MRIKSSMKEFNVRKALAWEAAKRIKKLWISPTLSERLKIRVFQTCVESVLLYAGETWSLTKLMEKQLDGTYTKLLRYPYTVEECKVLGIAYMPLSAEDQSERTLIKRKVIAQLGHGVYNV